MPDDLKRQILSLDKQFTEEEAKIPVLAVSGEEYEGLMKERGTEQDRLG